MNRKVGTMEKAVVTKMQELDWRKDLLTFTLYNRNICLGRPGNNTSIKHKDKDEEGNNDIKV